MDKSTLLDIHQTNNQVAWALADWVNEDPCAIDSQMVMEADPDGLLPKDVLYRVLFLALNDFGSEQRNRQIESDYLTKSIRCLDAKAYRNNPYLSRIVFPEARKDGWEFTHLEYQPYEAFVRDDILLEPDLREIPRIGFFTEKFRYPAVLQDSREWMAVKPSEIESMSKAIDCVSGDVITFGLGLGYFTYMVSLKAEVRSITVVERDQRVISLFKEHILPQFEYGKKVQIICSDAFDYMQNTLPGKNFNYAFVDLWHDTSDGLGCYLKAKALEGLSPQTQFLYWVEESLLSAYRWKVFDSVTGSDLPIGKIMEVLSDEGLQSMLSKVQIIR